MHGRNHRGGEVECLDRGINTFHITEALLELRQVVCHCPFRIDEFVDAAQLRPGNKFPWFLYLLVLHTPRSIVNNAEGSSHCQ